MALAPGYSLQPTGARLRHVLQAYVSTFIGPCQAGNLGYILPIGSIQARILHSYACLPGKSCIYTFMDLNISGTVLPTRSVLSLHGRMACKTGKLSSTDERWLSLTRPYIARHLCYVT